MGWFSTVHQDSGRRTLWNRFPIMECGKVVRNTPGSGWYHPSGKVDCAGCLRKMGR